MERIELQDMTPRVEGCKAVLYDDGIRQEVPTCMGGTAIVGCSDFDTCVKVSHERWDDLTCGRVIQRGKDGAIAEVTSPIGAFTSVDVVERTELIVSLRTRGVSNEELDAALDAHDRLRISARKAVMQAASPDGAQ